MCTLHITGIKEQVPQVYVKIWEVYKHNRQTYKNKEPRTQSFFI